MTRVILVGRVWAFGVMTKVLAAYRVTENILKVVTISFTKSISNNLSLYIKKKPKSTFGCHMLALRTRTKNSHSHSHY